MRKHILKVLLVAAISMGMLFSSCVGSFKLTNKVLTWNKSITGSKFVNALIYIPMTVVYGVTMVADGLVLNSIEFWTDKNPVNAGLTQEIEGENGTYLVETLENGYNVKNEQGEEADFIFDEQTKTWSVTVDGSTTELLTIKNEETAVVHVQGTSYEVALSEAGVHAFQQYMDEEALYFAAN